MVIGTLQFELSIPWAESLKDKRRVVRSLKDRLHREHMVSVAEVGALEVCTIARLGLACVAVDGARVGKVLDGIMSKLLALGDAELVACDRQIVRGHLGDHESLADPAGATADEDQADAAALRDELLEYAAGEPVDGDQDLQGGRT